MTVDNGVSSISGVAAAKAAGIDVLVTDHHLPGEQLPVADAIVNPNLTDCDFPSKALCGVGVAFYLMLALRAHFPFLRRHQTAFLEHVFLRLHRKETAAVDPGTKICRHRDIRRGGDDTGCQVVIGFGNVFSFLRREASLSSRVVTLRDVRGMHADTAGVVVVVAFAGILKGRHVENGMKAEIVQQV